MKKKHKPRFVDWPSGPMRWDSLEELFPSPWRHGADDSIPGDHVRGGTIDNNLIEESEVRKANTKKK